MLQNVLSSNVYHNTGTDIWEKPECPWLRKGSIIFDRLHWVHCTRNPVKLPKPRTKTTVYKRTLSLNLSVKRLVSG